MMPELEERGGYNWKHANCRSCFNHWYSNLASQVMAMISYSIDSDHKEELDFSSEHKNEEKL